jgi:hypothetical protein
MGVNATLPSSRATASAGPSSRARVGYSMATQCRSPVVPTGFSARLPDGILSENCVIELLRVVPVLVASNQGGDAAHGSVSDGFNPIVVEQNRGAALQKRHAHQQPLLAVTANHDAF